LREKFIFLLSIDKVHSAHSHVGPVVLPPFFLLLKKNLKMTEEGHRITEAFIVEALADQYGFEKSEAAKRISIKNFNVTEGSKKGDNFACVMKVTLSFNSIIFWERKPEWFTYSTKQISEIKSA
jgi:hypothetical protein